MDCFRHSICFIHVVDLLTNMEWYCERRKHSRGLKIKSGTTNLQIKGDLMECGSYSGIKLLEHAMKVVEKIF